MAEFKIYDCMRDGGDNCSRPYNGNMVSVLTNITVAEREGGGYEARLNINDTYGGGGTLTRELPDDIFVEDFAAFVENLCQKTSMTWFKADPAKVMALEGIREFFGYA